MSKQHRAPNDTSKSETSSDRYENMQTVKIKQKQGRFRSFISGDSYREEEWSRDDIANYPDTAFKMMCELTEQNTKLQRRIEDLEKTLDIQEQEYGELNEAYDKLRERFVSYTTLWRNNRRLKEQVTTLQLTNESQQKKLDQLNEQNAGLLSELAKLNRDKTVTGELGDHSGRYDLTQSYQVFRDTIHRTSRDIFNYLSVHVDQSLKTLDRTEKKREQAHIKSVLCEYILIKANPLVMTNLQTNRIQGQIEEVLGLTGEAGEFDLLGEKLKGIIKEGQELAGQFARAESLVMLWIEEKGKPCQPKTHDPDRYELEPNSPEEGMVLFTVYPGLRTGNRFLVPARVWLEEEKEASLLPLDDETGGEVTDTKEPSDEMEV